MAMPHSQSRNSTVVGMGVTVHEITQVAIAMSVKYCSYSIHSVASSSVAIFVLKLLY